jgi:hypothetical protein
MLTVFEIRLSNLLARKLQNYNIYIDSIEKIWQKSLVRINFHWPWDTGPLLKSMTAMHYNITLLKESKFESLISKTALVVEGNLYLIILLNFGS